MASDKSGREVIVKGKEVTDPNVEAVIARMRERSAKAIEQYQADTTRPDYSLADWLAEIRDESMDRAVYAQAAIAAMECAPRPADTDWPAGTPATLCRRYSHAWVGDSNVCQCKQRVLDGESSRPVTPTETFPRPQHEYVPDPWRCLECGEGPNAPAHVKPADFVRVETDACPHVQCSLCAPQPAADFVRVELPRAVYEWFLRRQWQRFDPVKAHDQLMAVTDACRATVRK